MRTACHWSRVGAILGYSVGLTAKMSLRVHSRTLMEHEREDLDWEYTIDTRSSSPQAMRNYYDIYQQFAILPRANSTSWQLFSQ